MAQLKNILQEITVSSSAGSDYTSLNDAITNIGTIKAFRIESAITLTANIIFPAGVTLIIGSQGSITGAFTLTGNNTVIKFEGFNNCISTNISFVGEWHVQSVFPEYFGAVGDGVADDQTPLEKAIELCKLTSTKNLELLSNKNYNSTGNLLDISGLHVYGRNSTLKKDDGTLLYSGGSVGTYYNLTTNAYKNDSWIKCNDATLLASLSNGDLVKIISNEICQPLSLENVAFGEIHQVREVDSENGIIYLNENLHWRYKISDTARVAKVTQVSTSIYDLYALSEGELVNGVGVNFSYSKVYATNFKARGFSHAVILSNCYRPYIRMQAFQTDKPGTGYGIIASDATMYADISFLNIGNRHSFTTGGGNSSGISWGTNVHDSIAFPSVIVDAGPFDTHASSGSCYFNNCTVFGGLMKSYEQNIAEWDDETTYAELATVRGLTSEMPFRVISENTNKEPETNIAEWYQFPCTAAVGFKAEGLYNYYNNCKVYNCASGFNISGTDMEEVSITNCAVYNSTYGCYSRSTATIDRITIDGLRHFNDNYVNGAAMSLACTYKKGIFRDIHCNNSHLLVLTANSDERVFEIDGYSFSSDFPQYLASVNNCSFDTLVFKNGKVNGVSNFISTVYASEMDDFELISVENTTITSPTADIISMYHPVKSLMLNSLKVIDPVNEIFLINSYRNVDNICFVGCQFSGTNATKLINAGALCTILNIIHTGNIFPNLITFRTGDGALSATVLTGGSIGVA